LAVVGYTIPEGIRSLTLRHDLLRSASIARAGRGLALDAPFLRV
jgi:hypothetical protein